MRQIKAACPMPPALDMNDVVPELVMEAKSTELSDRRAEDRHPFFHPVTITPSDDPQKSFSAFSREISPSGIGLLHNMPIERGDVTLAVRRSDDQSATLHVCIVWCQPCGEGWYLSGGYFTPSRRSQQPICPRCGSANLKLLDSRIDRADSPFGTGNAKKVSGYKCECGLAFVKTGPVVPH